MKIAAILDRKGEFVATVTPDSSVMSLLRVLAEHKIGAAVVTADGKTIVGIVSERDVVRGIDAHGPAILDGPVSGIMTAVSSTCEPATAVEEVMVIMTDRRVRHLPVLDDGNMVGIVSIGDVVKARIEKLEDERKSLLSYITS